MESLYVELVGYGAAFFGTSLMFPQVMKTWQTKRAKDLSLVMSLFYFMNCLLWLVYGLLINAIPLVLTNAIALVASVFLIFFKLKY